MSEWISVFDEPLPNPRDFPYCYSIFAVHSTLGMGIIFRSVEDGEWHYSSIAGKFTRDPSCVTHWMSPPNWRKNEKSL